MKIENNKSIIEYFLHDNLIEEDEQTVNNFLYKAINKNYTLDVVKMLLEHSDANNINYIDKNGKTILHCAVVNQNKPICELLLNHIVFNNRQILTTKDNANLTPLMRAAQKGNPDIYKLILNVMTKEEIGIE